MKIESFTNGENMTVEHELIKATGIGKAGGEPREAFLKRLLKSVDEAIRKILIFGRNFRSKPKIGSTPRARTTTLRNQFRNSKIRKK
jgi:hypothetical protein